MHEGTWKWQAHSMASAFDEQSSDDRPSEGQTSIVRFLLGIKLRELRLAAGVEPRHLAKLKLGSTSTTSRVENGQVPVAPDRVVALCKLYGVDQETTDQLETLAFRSSEESVVDEFSDVIPQWFTMYVGLESLAKKIRAWQPLVLPGLLQTPAYARAVFQAYRPALDVRSVDRSVTLRETRQRAVFSVPEPDRASLVVVLDEGVLLREMGGPQVAAAQLEHLRGLSAKRLAEIRVLRWSAGEHAALEGPFTMMEFGGSPLPDMVYVESSAGAKYLDRVRQLPRFRERFTSIIEKSVLLEEYAP